MHSEFGYLNRMNLGFVNPVCLICNGSCTSNRICIQIFSEENQLGTEKPLHMVMSEVLEREIQEETVHSTVICKKCYKIFEQVEELNHQVIDLKNNLIQNYKTSVEKFMKGEINASQSFIGESPDKDLHKEIENGDENGKSRNLLEMPSDDDQVVDGKILQGFGDLEKAFIREDCNVNDHSSSSETEYQTLPMQIKTESATSSESMERPNILRKKIILRRIKEDDEEERNKQNIVTANKGTSQDSTTFTCLLCPSDDAALYDARTIMQHVKATHDIRLYICDVCGMSFRKRTDLSAHLDEHVANEEGDFQCEICNRIFSNLRLFRIHKRMHYPQQKAWVCQTCGKKYSSKNLLEEHINTHTGVRPYICKQCGKDFASKYTFKAHEKTHSVRPRPFNCPKCHKTFLSQQNLTQHERTHLGIKDYACVVCGKQFGSAHNLEVHNIVHTGCKPFACGLCGKAFARKAEIRDHERTHTGERPYQCEFCGATFSQRSNLQSHKRATHYDDKRYKCESCGKGFKRRRLLDYHMKAAHTGERPFKCDVCEATFVYPEHFKKHRRIHTGEKPFLCEICGKAFNSRDNRNAHRFVHSDKKPYECLVCGAGFMRKPLLYQHMETQNHINDTIVVNQPRISPEDEQLVTINADGEMEIVDHVLVDGDLTSHNIDITSQTQDLSGDEPTHAIEHIIIDGEHIKFADEDIVETEDFQFQEVIARDTLLNGETQIMETPDGPIQLVKVRIPNENGEEEEAWIKIVAEEC